MSAEISSEVVDRTILITGGTGSFGNRVAPTWPSLNPRRIIVYSRDEKKQWEMQQRFPDFDYVIGDVRDPAVCEKPCGGSTSSSTPRRSSRCHPARHIPTRRSRPTPSARKRL